MRLLIEGRLEAESRNQNCLDSIEGGTQESRPTETPYAEDGTYGVVGGRGLVTPSYPIFQFSVFRFLIDSAHA